VPLDRRLEPHSCPPTTPPPAPHTPSLHDALPIYWYGVTPAALDKAKQQAGRDYVVFVVDMYGKGVRPADDKQALAQVQGLYPKRSEEHTSELQSRENLVCRLLLEKKKTIQATGEQ